MLKALEGESLSLSLHRTGLPGNCPLASLCRQLQRRGDVGHNRNGTDAPKCAIGVIFLSLCLSSTNLMWHRGCNFLPPKKERCNPSRPKLRRHDRTPSCRVSHVLSWGSERNASSLCVPAETSPGIRGCLVPVITCAYPASKGRDIHGMVYPDTRDYCARNGYLGNRRAEQRRRRSTRSRRRRPRVGHGVRIACLDGRLAQAAAALHQLQRGLPEHAAAAGGSRSSSWSSAGAVARKARSTRNRAGCRGRGPQPPAAGGERPQAACKSAFVSPIRAGRGVRRRGRG